MQLKRRLAMEIYMNVLKKYAVFHGRANRTEYWVFFLVNILIMLVLGFIEGALGIAEYTDQSMLAVYYQLFIIIPTIAVGVRRMHDVDKSGWLAIPVYSYSDSGVTRTV